MKKYFLVFIILLLFISMEIFPSIVVKAGINISNITFFYDDAQVWDRLTGKIISYDYAQSWDSLASLRIGVLNKNSVSGRFSFQPEIFFVRKGAKTEFKFLDQKITEKIKLDYIEIPILVRYSVISGSKLNVGVLAGGYIAFNLSAEQATYFGDDSRSENVGDEIKNQDYGVVAGLELVLNKKNFDLILDLRLTVGMVNIKSDLEIGESVKNRSMSFMIGIGF